MRRPQREPRSGLPERVTIYEVGPRDGLQNEKTVVPAAVKAEFIRRLAAAGLGTIETTSFVPPTWVPQLADAEEVLGLTSATRAAARAGRCSCPTSGASTARSRLGVGAVAIFGSATETFARKNLNRTRGRVGRRCSPRSWRGPGAEGCGCAPTSRCASATRGRARCRSSRSSTSRSG